MNLPNGPRTPQFIRMLKLIARPLDYLEDYGRRYGDCFVVGSKSNPVVYLSHPEAIQTIFTADPQLFETGRANGILRFLLGENSLLLLDRDRHARQRRLLMPPFHGDRMRTYGELICDVAQAVTAQWQPGESVAIRSYMQDITLQVILQAVFGLHRGERYEELRQRIGTLLDNMGTPFSAFFVFFRSLQRDWGPWSPWGRFIRQREQIDRLLYDEIRDRKQAGDFSGTDILTMLMSARDEAGQAMTEQELRDELMTLLVAGHETTASALSWAMYWIHSQPDVRDKLREELASLGANPNPIAISQLPYLNAVCQETLRIYPIAITTSVRILKAPLKIGDYEFEPGTVLFPCIYLTHQREELYPEPKRFKPDRFLQQQYSPYEYLPFGGGNRRCIGAAFAQFEMKLVLATILSRFELTLPSRRPVKPVRRGLTVAPPAGMRMVVKQRREQEVPVELTSI